MPGFPTLSGTKSIPPFVLGCAWSSRIFSCSHGDVSVASLEARADIVDLIGPPDMGVAEASLRLF